MIRRHVRNGFGHEALDMVSTGMYAKATVRSRLLWNFEPHGQRSDLPCLGQ
jgi:hypothetical protein